MSLLSSDLTSLAQIRWLLVVFIIVVGTLLGGRPVPIDHAAAQEAISTPTLTTDQKIEQILQKIRAVQATQEALVSTEETQTPTTIATVIPVETPTSRPTVATHQQPAATPTAKTQSAPVLTIARPLVNLRSGPGTDYAVVGSATNKESFTITGRNSDNSWYEVERAAGTLAWVWSGIVTVSGDVAVIAVATVSAAPAGALDLPPADAITSTEIAVATTAQGAAAGRLIYSVANIDAKRWELWEYSFATGHTNKIADWRTELAASRNGAQIAYYAWPQEVGDEAGIWIMDSDYTNNRLLVEGGAYPSFNPGGDRLVLSDGEAIYVINSDGGGLRWLTSGEYPAWNPADNRIVHRACVGGSCGLWIIDANSQDPNARHRVTTGGSDGQPAWSPNGQRLAYISQEDGNFEIYMVNVDGSGKTRLTTEPASDGLPVWSPNGEWIAFRSDRGGSWAVYIMRPDGSDLRKVVDADVLPLWFFEKMIWQS